MGSPTKAHCIVGAFERWRAHHRDDDPASRASERRRLPASAVDMLRYTRFGAGASWVEEYGDPDKPEDRAYIEKYSAYQNVKPDVKYPGILFIRKPATTG